MFKRFLTLIFLASFIWSCTSNTGTLLSTDALVEGPDPGAPVILYLTAGTSIEYLGEQPFPTDGFAKVRAGRNEGYVLAKGVVFNAKPAAALESINAYYAKDSDDMFPMTYEGGFLLTDSVSGDRTHAYSILSSTHGWVETKYLTTDPADVEVSAAINRMVNGTQRDIESAIVFQNAAVKYPDNRFLQTFKVDLSEPDYDDLIAMQSKMIFAYDKPQNTVTIAKSHATSIVSMLLADLLPRTQGDNQYGYHDEDGTFVNTIPTEIYFRRYLAALPSYVKVASLSDAVDWDMEKKESPEAAFFLYRMDRSPENLRSLYDRFRPLIENMITSGTLRDIRAEGNALIKVYDHITSLPNYQKVLSDVTRNATAWDEKHTNDQGRIPGGYAILDKSEVYKPIRLQSVFDAEDSENKAMWYHTFWVRRFNEGNAQVVYEILKELVAITPGDAPEYVEGSDEGGEEVDEGFGDAPDDYPVGDEEPTSTTCIFKGYGVGDCAHYDFGECGDYGDADVSALPPDEKALWQSLVVVDDGQEVGNPELVGKKFFIVETVTYTNICNEGQGGMGRAPKILSITKVDD
ncbi:MAG TPA: SH3 domain-containing protein [Cyclobacteriaceae bacterium]|nr:SH3 domain-containing protein [Cyclobacteriaceae bacterium]